MTFVLSGRWLARFAEMTVKCDSVDSLVPFPFAVLLVEPYSGDTCGFAGLFSGYLYDSRRYFGFNHCLKALYKLLETNRLLVVMEERTPLLS